MCITEFLIADDTLKYHGKFCNKCSECLASQQRDSSGEVIIAKNWDLWEMCDDFKEALFSLPESKTHDIFCMTSIKPMK